MAIEQFATAVPPSESVTSIVNKNLPAKVGVPLITPVLVLSVNPGGRIPPTSAYVYGAVPPLATMPCPSPPGP